MLVLTGNLGGKTFDNTIISASALMDLIGAKVPESINIEFVRERRTPDKFGQVRTPSSFSSACAFSSIHDGQSFTLRYATSSRPAKSGNGKEYFPARVSFRGAVGSFGGPTIEQGLFLLLHPLCRNSPWANKSKPAILEVVDYAGEAKNRLESMQLEIAVRDEILTMDAEAIKFRGKGLVVNGRSFQSESNYDVNSLRLALVDALRSNPVSFIRAWNDAGTHNVSVINDSLDKGLIIPFSNAGKNGFAWAAKYGGDVIMTYGQNENGKSALLRFAIDNQDAVIGRASKYLGTTSAPGHVPELLTVDLPAMPSDVADAFSFSDIDLVKACLVADRIEYDRSERAVYALKNNVRKDVIFVVPEGESDWKESFANHLAENSSLKRNLALGVGKAKK